MSMSLNGKNKKYKEMRAKNNEKLYGYCKFRKQIAQ